MMLERMNDGRFWYEVAPVDAVGLILKGDEGPLNDTGETCPWPWDPQQLVGAPIGQYHCEYCGAMVVAGVRHLDARDTGRPVDGLHSALAGDVRWLLARVSSLEAELSALRAMRARAEDVRENPFGMTDKHQAVCKRTVEYILEGK